MYLLAMLIVETFEMLLKAMLLLEKQIWAGWKLFFKAGFEKQQTAQLSYFLGHRYHTCFTEYERILETVHKIISFFEQNVVT